MNNPRFDLSKIRGLASDRGLNLTELNKQLGFGKTGVYRILKHNSTSLETLMQIADFFKDICISGYLISWADHCLQYFVFIDYR